MKLFFLSYLQNLESFMNAGGIIMFPLVLISFIMWALIINRAFFFRRLYRKNMSRQHAAALIMANEFPDPRRYKGIIASLLVVFLKRRSGDPETDRNILDESVMSVVSALNRYLAAIKVLAGVAPLLGLLGTVLGMITTFDIIAVFGTSNVKALSGGISEALITTQTGLLVAIPGLYMSNFLSRRADNLKKRVASVGLYLSRYVVQAEAQTITDTDAGGARLKQETQ